MKPAAFHYLRARSVEEAVGWLQAYGSDAKVLAGGQSLVPLLNLRLARPQYLIDLNQIPSLDAIRVEGERLHVGALVRHADLARSPVARRLCPLLPQAAGLIGHPAIRNRGTLGGSLVHADPSAELPVAAAALGGEATVQGPEGARRLPMAELFLSYFTTSLGPDELLTAVDFPLVQPQEGWDFLEEARREGDFALVAVAAGVRLAPDGTVAMLRLVVGGVADVPWVAPVAARVGQPARPALWSELAEAAAAAADPGDDLHASAGLRRHLLRSLAAKALARAAARAAGEGVDRVG